MEVSGANNRDSELILRRTGISVLGVFFLTVFESKALINLFGIISLLLSFIYIWKYDKRIFINNQFLFLFIAAYPIGFLLGFLSDSGGVGAFSFLDRFKFMLLMLPLTVFVQHRKDLHFLLIMFFISATIAVFYGIYEQQPYGLFHGVHKIGRTADMMVVAFLSVLIYLTLFNNLMSAKSFVIKIILLFLNVLFAWAIMMSEMRGSWLGLFVGGLVSACILLLYNRKALLFNSLIIVFVFLCIGYLGSIKDHFVRIDNQIESISDTESNYSNNARLHLWKTGWDFSQEHFFFGTGAKQNKPLFIAFFNEQTDEYQKKYQLAIKYPGELHNSYMQIHVETGVIFFLFYIFGIIYSLLVMAKNIKRVPIKDQKYLVVAIVSASAFLVCQFFHSDLYHYGSVVFYLSLFSGCYVLNQNNQAAWFGKGYKYES